MVFPGGGVAPEDERLKDLMNGLIQHERLVDRLGTPDAVSYLGAAVRELFEEAGLLIALDEIDADVVAQWRTAVLTGSKNFYDILSELRGPLDLENVVYFAHWRTPQQRARRFDTRFFAVKSPDNQVATCDGHETVEHHWVRPAEALERFRQGEWKLLLPTRTILDELARERDVGSVLAKWRARSTIAMTQPVEVVENGVTTVRLPD
jgi:8-oxo-dGTP pyrophosphatase MutT (NUDIX family)